MVALVRKPNLTSIRNPTLDMTLAVMRQKANEGKKSLRPLAEKICVGIEQGDYNSEIMALYHWVCSNCRYMRDIYDVEYVQAPVRFMERKPGMWKPQGDCDDVACLLAALCMAVGNQCRFLVVGFEDKQPSHVFCQVAVRGQFAGQKASVDGNATGDKLWITVDPVAAENTKQMHGRVGFVKVFPL